MLDGRGGSPCQNGVRGVGVGFINQNGRSPKIWKFDVSSQNFNRSNLPPPSPPYPNAQPPSHLHKYLPPPSLILLQMRPSPINNNLTTLFNNAPSLCSLFNLSPHPLPTSSYLYLSLPITFSSSNFLFLYLPIRFSSNSFLSLSIYANQILL